MNWFRYYTDTLDNPKVQELPGDLFKFWINILCLARLYNGELPSEKIITFRLRMADIDTTSALHELEMCGLLDRTKGRQWVPHDWNEYQYISDNSTDRVKKHRMKQELNVSSNVSVTPPEQNRTETEQNRGAPHGLNGHADVFFEELWNAYPAKGRTEKTLAMQYYIEEVRSEETHRVAIAAINGKWADSDKWQKGFILALPKWLHNRCWEEQPVPGKPPVETPEYYDSAKEKKKRDAYNQKLIDEHAKRSPA